MRPLLLAALLLFPFAACGEDDPDPAPAKVCSPGKQEACACPGGGQGAQVCKDDGSGYGACSPCSVGAGGSGGGAPMCNKKGGDCSADIPCCEGLKCSPTDRICGGPLFLVAQAAEVPHA